MTTAGMNLATLCDTEVAILRTWGGPVRARALVYLLLEAGLRVNEARQLQLRHVWMGNQLNQSVNVSAEISKSRRARFIPMTPLLRATLQLYGERLPTLESVCLDDYLFPGQAKSKPISVRQARNIVYAATVATLGRGINPHCLRHTFATRLMRVTNIRVVQDLLGHRNLQSTQIYTHPNGQDLTKAIEDM
jgi:site-specific recombinase XerD